MNENIIQYQEYLLKQLDKSAVKKISRLEYLKILAKTCTEYIIMIPADKQDMKDEVKQYVREYMLDFQKDESKTPKQAYDDLKAEVAAYYKTHKRTSKRSGISFGMSSSLPKSERNIKKMLDTPNNHKQVEAFVKSGHKRSTLKEVLSDGINCPEYYLILNDYGVELSSQALYNCIEQNDKLTFIEILKRGVKTYNEYEGAIWSLASGDNQKDYLDLILDYGSDDINYQKYDVLGPGPDYQYRDNPYFYCNKSIFDIVIRDNHMDIAQRIIDNGYIVNKPIEKTEEYGTQRVCGDSMIIACRWCRADAIQGLIDFNYNMSNRYAYQETPLHVLTWFHLNSEDLMKYSGTQFAKCVELLAHNGVDINAQDENGKTPLHIITGECAVKWVDDGTEFYKKTPTNRFCYNAEFLLDNMLQNGAKINIKDKDGNTPLHLALSKEPSAEMLTIVEKLIQKGARPDIHNQQMVTPYAQAFELLKNASPANKHIAQQILKLCQDAKPSLWAKMTRYFAGVQRSA